MGVAAALRQTAMSLWTGVMQSCICSLELIVKESMVVIRTVCCAVAYAACVVLGCPDVRRKLHLWVGAIAIIFSNLFD